MPQSAVVVTSLTPPSFSFRLFAPFPFPCRSRFAAHGLQIAIVVSRIVPVSEVTREQQFNGRYGVLRRYFLQGLV